jgi:hypothetical protein
MLTKFRNRVTNNLICIRENSRSNIVPNIAYPEVLVLPHSLKACVVIVSKYSTTVYSHSISNSLFVNIIL